MGPDSKKAPTRPQNGDTVAILTKSPSMSKESNQVQFTGPNKVKTTAIQMAGKRKFIQPKA